MSNDTEAFIDATCQKCRQRIGWFGRVVDQPACPRCGTKPDPVALEADQAELDEFRKLLTKAREAKARRERWREARISAGLTLRQAAKLLEVTPSDLSDVETGRKRASEALVGRIARCYEGEK